VRAPRGSSANRERSRRRCGECANHGKAAKKNVLARKLATHANAALAASSAKPWRLRRLPRQIGMKMARVRSHLLHDCHSVHDDNTQQVTPPPPHFFGFCARVKTILMPQIQLSDSDEWPMRRVRVAVGPRCAPRGGSAKHRAHSLDIDCVGLISISVNFRLCSRRACAFVCESNAVLGYTVVHTHASDSVKRERRAEKKEEARKSSHTAVCWCRCGSRGRLVVRACDGSLWSTGGRLGSADGGTTTSSDAFLC
jgi:hypothetical protein